jgi:puromycin-sensitive aminopeptidase
VGDSEAAYRLPRSVIPSRYELTIEPDLDAGTFSGSEVVAVTVHEPVDRVILNAKELEVEEGGEIRSVEAGGAVAIDRVEADAQTERVTLHLAAPLEPGDWLLHLGFRGEINRKMVGFYRSSYDDEGVEHVIATTHFEATDARMCFPCWDEPDLKAVFGITMVVAEGLTALSNGPEAEREALGDGRARVRFADTMVMSTYLVCLVVGPLAVTDAVDARGVPVRVVCRPGQEHLAPFGLDEAVSSLNWFADYYAIAYPDAKLDNVAIPDFAQGAMENLGCVTYRETLLLLDPGATTPEEQLGVAETVAHELAHMWFGDLVTMRWWNGIWLNEAFATFMSYLAVDALHPEWRVWDAFTRIRANAFEVDALESTRTIEYPVASPDDASGMFDTLTYTKGGAVLRMLEQWLGPERFRDGIRRYLAKHAYGNTETHDLWDALEAETGEPVRRVMDAWIFQPGYPAITVRREGEELRLAQHRFIPSDPDDGTTWPVPLLIRQVVDGDARTRAVLVEADGLAIPLEDPEALVVVNAGGSSFVRVFYDDELRERLVARAFTDLSPAERQCLVDDAWAAVVAGDAPATAFLDLVAGFSLEDDLSVWRAILTGLSWCDRFVDGDARDRFRDLVRDLVRPAFGRLGWEPREGGSDLERELRGELIRALGILGDDPETQAQAREAERDATVEPAVAAASVDVVATGGGEGEFDRFFARAKDASTPQEQERYREGLARFRDPALMDRLLAASLDELRPQDSPFVLARSVMNRDLGAQAWRFVADHWDELGDRIAASNVIALAVGVRTLTRPDEVEHVQRFFAEHDIPQNHQMLEQALERQRVFAALRERATRDLEQRFGAGA